MTGTDIEPPGSLTAGAGEPVAGSEILHVIGALEVGGAETHLVRVLPELQRRGWRTSVYTLTHKGPLAVTLEAAGIHVAEPPGAAVLRRLPRRLRGALTLPLTALTLWWLMVRRRPALVHFFLPYAYLVGGLCALASPVPARVMSRRSLNDYQRRHRALARLERWMHHRMSVLLGNSGAVVRQLLEEGAPRSRVGLIHNGIDATPYRDGHAGSAIRAELGISTGSLVLVIVANIIPYKGHADLVEALGEICGELPGDWVLLCVGADTGPGVALAERCAELGLGDRVRWLGRREDVARVLAAADVGISSSHEEGFSNSVLECMAAGLAVVVTDVGGNPEAVTHRVSGLVVPPRNPGALGRAILELAGDGALRRKLGEAARGAVDARFSLTACADGYARLYAALVAGDAVIDVPDVLGHGEASGGLN